MADKLTTTNTLGVGLEYLDSEKNTEKTVYIKFPNPKNSLTENQVKTAVRKLISGEEPLFLTINGTPFDTATAIVTAYRETVQAVEFDIGIE